MISPAAKRTARRLRHQADHGQGAGCSGPPFSKAAPRSCVTEWKWWARKALRTPPRNQAFFSICSAVEPAVGAAHRSTFLATEPGAHCSARAGWAKGGIGPGLAAACLRRCDDATTAIEFAGVESNAWQPQRTLACPPATRQTPFRRAVNHRLPKRRSRSAPRHRGCAAAITTPASHAPCDLQLLRARTSWRIAIPREK